MPLTGTASTWRDSIISGLGIDFTGMTPSEESYVKDSWLAICQAHITHITTNALVSTTGVTGTGPPTGPYPITAQPGIIT